MKYYSFYLLHRQAQTLALFHALKINNECGLLVIKLNSSEIDLNLRLTLYSTVKFKSFPKNFIE